MIVVNIIMGIVALFAVYSLFRSLTSHDDDSIVGERAPAFMYSSLDLSTEKLLSPASRRVTVFFVFSAECPHCAEAVKVWNAIATETRAPINSLMGVSISPQGETVEFMNRNQTQFRVILAGQEFMQGYRLTGIPATIIIHNGIIADLIKGVPDQMAILSTLTQINKEE